MRNSGRTRKQHKVIKSIECKHCSYCKRWKALDLFYRSKHSWDGLHNLCKECGKENSKMSHRRNAAANNKKRRNRTTFDMTKVKSHMFANGIECKQCYKCNKQKPLSEYTKCSRNWDSLADICRLCNKAACKKRYNEKKHTREFKRKRRERQKQKLMNDPTFRLERNLRNRLYQAIRGKVKYGKMFELLGCNKECLIEHLEKQFVAGMSWDNYGSKWHVDHIKPCAAFDLSDKAEQIRCFHYTNLQPLWASENLSKSSKVVQ